MGEKTDIVSGDGFQRMNSRRDEHHPLLYNNWKGSPGCLRRTAILFLLIFLFFHTHSQDTLRVMHYNLLYYGETTGFCNDNNNGIPKKNAALREIIEYTSPDIFTVNEISESAGIHDMLKDSVLEVVYPGRYARAGFSNTNGSRIVNDLYYDTEKVMLWQNYGIYCDVRDADAYELGILPNHNGGDTAMLICVVTHLKAGSGNDDEAKRAAMASDIMNWLSNQGYTGNNLLLGDLNLKESSEPAWYNLTQFPNAAIRFYDPVDAAGAWNNNPQYAWIHSQSTHSSSNGCAASGGMDDRFDFILTSQALLNGMNGMQYVYGSYNTIGQDGNRFNSSIVAPANTSVPADVAQALYDMSDHLPIMIGLRFGPGTGIREIPEGNIIAQNPSAGSIVIRGNLPFRQMHARVFSNDGRFMGTEPIPAGETIYRFSMRLRPGFYIIHLKGDKQDVFLKAVIN